MTRLTIIALSVVVLVANGAQAATYRTILEQDTDGPQGAPYAGISFDTFDDLLNSTSSGGQFASGLNTPGFTFAGLAFDGQYRAILESDTDTAQGGQFLIATFDTFADFISGNNSGGQFASWNNTPGFSFGGLAYDGQYRLVLESDTDTAQGGLYAGFTFDTFADLLSGNNSGGQFATANVTTGFSLGGFAYDGQYRAILEQDSDGPNGGPYAGVTYDTFDDFLAGANSGAQFVSSNNTPGFSFGGLAYDGSKLTVTPVPLPAGLPLTLSGFLALSVLARRPRRPAFRCLIKDPKRNNSSRQIGRSAETLVSGNTP